MKAVAADTTLGWVVNVTLDSTEAKAFNAMAARDYHRTVTFLVNGIAIGEATVQVKNFGGSFAFGPALMTKAAAKLLARQLDAGP
jgi:preprotein translocase subunit SecD